MTVRYHMHLTPGDDRELVGARLWAAGALGLQELHDALVAWFPARSDDVPPGGSWSVEPERDWLSDWRDGLEEVRVGAVRIVPSWLEPGPTPDTLTLRLDPGVAFGTGHHATTALCLEQLQHLPLTGRDVLDVGTGSGILAIAAKLLGAGSVRAVDIDPQAIDTCRTNARANDVDISIGLGSVGGEQPADLVLANLLTPTLHALAAELVAATRPRGHLVVSGVASERAEGVADALVAAGATRYARSDHDGWAAVVVVRAEAGR